MSALSPAPAPASRARWAPPLNSLECALTDCCLSYKQNAAVSPLESALTNASHLPDSKHFESSCLDTLAHSFPATPLDSALTKNTGGGVPAPSLATRVSSSGVPDVQTFRRSDIQTFSHNYIKLNGSMSTITAVSGISFRSRYVIAPPSTFASSERFGDLSK